MMSHKRSVASITTLLLSLAVRPAPATWSICIADTDTREVAAGTVTCLSNFDLLATVPVIVVEKGAGASQSFIDGDGARRQVMGVYDDRFVVPIAEALAALGAIDAMVMHSADGLDEF